MMSELREGAGLLKERSGVVAVGVQEPAAHGEGTPTSRRFRDERRGIDGSHQRVKIRCRLNQISLVQQHSVREGDLATRLAGERTSFQHVAFAIDDASDAVEPHQTLQRVVQPEARGDGARVRDARQLDDHRINSPFADQVLDSLGELVLHAAADAAVSHFQDLFARSQPRAAQVRAQINQSALEAARVGELVRDHRQLELVALVDQKRLEQR
mmetsp:Transcript_8440/g.26017  ORF Transcript_8440/g.26017 Transcript_8440/m.26017 type:complete len:213 (-) Transcript_8440:176-814(-)